MFCFVYVYCCFLRVEGWGQLKTQDGGWIKLSPWPPINHCFINCSVTPEARLTASTLRQDPGIHTVTKNANFLGTVQTYRLIVQVSSVQLTLLAHYGFEDL